MFGIFKKKKESVSIPRILPDQQTIVASWHNKGDVGICIDKTPYEESAGVGEGTGKIKTFSGYLPYSLKLGPGSIVAFRYYGTSPSSNAVVFYRVIEIKPDASDLGYFFTGKVQMILAFTRQDNKGSDFNDIDECNSVLRSFIHYYSENSGAELAGYLDVCDAQLKR